MDGVRTLAVTFVLVYHTIGAPFSGGGRGVDVFFVLSGYLITGVLLQGDRLGAFWLRRVRRLVPALVLMVAAYLALGPIFLPEHAAARFVDALLTLTYTSNYALAGGFRDSLLGHTWSLSAEMQFYLLWPLVLPWLLKLSDPVRPLLLVWAAMTISRAVFAFISPSWEAAYFPLHFHATGLILGCALALSRQTAPAYIGVVGLIGLLGLGMVEGNDVSWAIAASEICAVMLLAAIHTPRLQQAFSWGPLPLLGKLSYGIYLWHLPISEAVKPWPWWAELPFTFALSTGLAAISYYTVERWARQGTGSPKAVFT